MSAEQHSLFPFIRRVAYALALRAARLPDSDEQPDGDAMDQRPVIAQKLTCPECKGFGLRPTGERDEWGFGKPCTRCNGTGKLTVKG